MAFPTTSVLDDFNRTNEGPPLSSAWTLTFYATSGLEVVSNTARQGDADQAAAEHRNGGTFGPDTEAYITLITRATEGYYSAFYVDARLQSPTTSGIDGYEVEVVCREVGSNVNIARIWKIVNNSFSQLGADITGLTIANGDSFGIEVTGTGTVTIKAYHKPSAGSWTELGSRTDSSSPIDAAGYIGFGIYDSPSVQTVLDDFGGGTVVAGGGTLTINKSESIAVTESCSVSMTRLVNKSDAVAVAESQNVTIVTGALEANKSEAIALTENQAASVSSPQVNKSEAVSTAENVSVSIQSAATLSVSVSDDITLIEPTFFGFESLEVNKSETVNTAESHAEAVGSSQVNKSDAVTVTENHAELVTSFVNVTDAIVTAESYSVATAALAVDVSEAVTVTESASVNLPIAGTHTVNVNESITLTENVAAEVGSPQVSVSDVVGAAESVGAEVGSPQVNVSGAVAVGEGVTLFVNEAGALGVNVSDGASLAEAVTLALNTLVIASQESIGLSEAASVLVMGSVIGGDAAVEFSRASATTGIAKATASVEVK